MVQPEHLMLVSCELCHFPCLPCCSYHVSLVFSAAVMLSRSHTCVNSLCELQGSLHTLSCHLFQLAACLPCARYKTIRHMWFCEGSTCNLQLPRSVTTTICSMLVVEAVLPYRGATMMQTQLQQRRVSTTCRLNWPLRQQSAGLKVSHMIRR